MTTPTTIKSSELDFQNLKETLKTFLKESGEFNDYDFEGAGLSNILDVLAHNTHLSALIANFALNESYLVTAQLRPSVVSLAESLGYIPDSKKSAEATVNLTINAVGVPGLAEVAVLQPGELVLRGSKDDIDYTFTNRDALIANAQGTGVYTFSPFDAPDEPIKVYEGIERDQNFIVGTEKDTIYVVPDPDIDIETAIIKVFSDQGSSVVDGGSAFNIYTNLLDATTIDEASRLYVLREAPNGYYELTFGNGNSLGEAPTAGNVINVNYLRTRGKEANGIRSLVLKRPIAISENEISPDNIAVTMLSTTAGGGDKETIESMRKNAPYQYATQNRMVTALDYSALILKRFSTFIEDIKSWGGEDDPKPDYGKVFTSIVWKEGLDNSTIADVRKGIIALADDFSIVSFDLKFTDPVTTYISTETFFQFNPSMTGINSSTIRSNVERNIAKYFAENTGKFDQVFRRSNMLTEVDATDPSVLSSRSKTVIQRRILPLLNYEYNYEQTFPTAIQVPEASDEATIYSSLFTYKNQIAFIRNKLLDRVRLTEKNEPTQFRVGPSTSLEVVTQSGRVLIENVGEYFPETGRVFLKGLRVQNVPGGKNYIKIFAIPANQSVVVSELNNIIKFDPEESFTKAIVVETR
jgi:hypothetical protein